MLHMFTDEQIGLIVTLEETPSCCQLSVFLFQDCIYQHAAVSYSTLTLGYWQHWSKQTQTEFIKLARKTSLDNNAPNKIPPGSM